ncbi:hypothetical protein AB0C34_16940 [Nocardia sp. NPDC049220]|uniref:hypothetical protein n=1 Tax=Nocardia sp. NPDC049220 TaxID=3155273 RepID=UPI003403C6AF
MTLTREAIDNINEFYRLTDDINDAYFFGPNATVNLEAERRVIKAKITADQFSAYLDAGIRPPHVVGQDVHDMWVAENFPELAE